MAEETDARHNMDMPRTIVGACVGRMARPVQVLGWLFMVGLIPCQPKGRMDSRAGWEGRRDQETGSWEGGEHAGHNASLLTTASRLSSNLPRAQLVELPVPGHHDAVVAVPLYGGGMRPVVVAVHGNYDRPEEHCATWSAVAGNSAYVLCPRGLPRSDVGPAANRWTFGWNGRDLEREIDAGLTALRKRYDGGVDEGPVVFVGFSLGAILGADIVLWNPSRYQRVVLVEGGTANWSLATAKGFARKGGKKVLFACGQSACVQKTQIGLHWLATAGVSARTAYGGTIGHTFRGIVAREIEQNWRWLTEGDPRWAVAGEVESSWESCGAAQPETH